MLITLTAVTKGPRHSALPPTTLEFGSGTVTLARAETERRPTVLGLIASGRMRPDTGSVLLDGHADYSGMRRRIALVDALGVSDPAADVTVAEVVAEELMFAGRLGHPRAVSRVFADLGLADRDRSDMADLAPLARIRLLTELAVMRGGVDGLVITSPDRHGGDPLDWWQAAGDLAERGYAVLAIAGEASAHAVAGHAVAGHEGAAE
ncbi:hypothetical protein [Cryobacterium tagatosivorans]|uniref:ABC transporter ATP-binding protein n=1 Tax=Cryobacterium tagatosivorans TaxID=1259199 RepID=A0A4R8UH25_9MICO|nr:hypothetical protein [Cryobacterium tagatosivorans]TFB53515.1 hypothetical protein E3O23_05015 [Cryobacterium tagatosivorans]